MFERFNEQARQVVVLAQDEARSLGHDHIGSEHLLLGLLRVDDELVDLLGDPADARRHVVELVGEGETASPGQMPLTEHARATFEGAVADAAGAIVGQWQIAVALLALPDDATAVRRCAPSAYRSPTCERRSSASVTRRPSATTRSEV